MRILYDYSTGKYLHHDERLSSGNGSMYLTIQPLMIFGLGIFANVLMKLYGTSRLPAGTAAPGWAPGGGVPARGGARGAAALVGGVRADRGCRLSPAGVPLRHPAARAGGVFVTVHGREAAACRV